MHTGKSRQWPDGVVAVGVGRVSQRFPKPLFSSPVSCHLSPQKMNSFMSVFLKSKCTMSIWREHIEL